MEGNIMIDEILASCYTSVSNHDLVHLVMKPLQCFPPTVMETIFGIDNGSPSIVRIFEHLGNCFLPDRLFTYLKSN